MRLTRQVQSRPEPLIWASRGVPELCDPADVELLTGLYGWWNLTDHVSTIDLANHGQFNLPMVDVSLGLPVVYLADATRGGPPGAAVFNANDATGLSAVDPASNLIAPPFTIGLWVRLDDKVAVNGSILTYHTGTTVRYRLRHMATIDRFVFTVVGFSGTATVVAERAGAPSVGVWYWIELGYNIDTTAATIRVAPQRSGADEPLLADANYALVPGAILESGGALTLGYYGSGVNFSFNGAAAGLGWWNRALTVCERGRINGPNDYPFTTETARLTDDGGARLSDDGQVRILD